LRQGAIPFRLLGLPQQELFLDDSFRTACGHFTQCLAGFSVPFEYLETNPFVYPLGSAQQRSRSVTQATCALRQCHGLVELMAIDGNSSLTIVDAGHAIQETSHRTRSTSEHDLELP
jgi:hypothetical protein